MTTTDLHLEQISGEIDTQILALAEQVEALRSLLGEFVTRKELQTTLLESITAQLTTRLDEIDAAGEQRHGEFVKHYEERIASLASKEEVAGVIAASAENAQRLTTLEATSSTSINALKERMDKVEDKQLKLDASIKDIRGDTEKIAANAEKMSTAFVEYLGRDEKYKKENDREIDALKIAQAHSINDMRETQSQVIRHHQLINDQRTWIIEKLTPMELVIMGDEKSDTAGIAAEIRDVKTRQLALDNGLSTFTKFINNRIGQMFIIVFMAGNIISFFAQLANQH